MDKRKHKKARDERKSQTSSRTKREDPYRNIQPEHDLWGKIPKRLRSHYLLVLPQAKAAPEQPELEQPELMQPEPEQPKPMLPKLMQPEPEQPELMQPEQEQPKLMQPEPEQPEPMQLEQLESEMEETSSLPELAVVVAAVSSPATVDSLPLHEWTKADLLRHKLKRSV